MKVYSRNSFFALIYNFPSKTLIAILVVMKFTVFFTEKCKSQMPTCQLKYFTSTHQQWKKKERKNDRKEKNNKRIEYWRKHWKWWTNIYFFKWKWKKEGKKKMKEDRISYWTKLNEMFHPLWFVYAMLS